jgi:methyl-accepting chemotaxis protein
MPLAMVKNMKSSSRVSAGIILLIILSFIMGFSALRSLSQTLQQAESLATHVVDQQSISEQVTLLTQQKEEASNTIFLFLFLIVILGVLLVISLYGAESSNELAKLAEALNKTCLGSPSRCPQSTKQATNNPTKNIIDLYNRLISQLEKGLEETDQHWKNIAQGNLDARMTDASNDLFSRTRKTANQTTQLLDSFIHDLDNSAHHAYNGHLSELMLIPFEGRWLDSQLKINLAFNQFECLLLAVNDVMIDIIDGQLNTRIDLDMGGAATVISDRINSALDTIMSPMSATLDILEGMSRGDLSLQMAGKYTGDFASLQSALNGSIMNLQGMIEELRSSSDSVNEGITQIKSSSEDLSNRTQAQAASLEETAASMEEMTSTVRQNAEHAQQARDLALVAGEYADSGGSVIQQAISAMDTIDESSQKISDIISVIDSIAFQTNLLALNAAVEAARAGEQGRGFAVVAGEVRNLASRSAEAAKEIAQLIKDTVGNIKNGTKLVTDSGKSLNQIVKSTKEVGQIVSEIAAASQEQIQGIEQISSSIAHIDAGTQQNAAMVEETAAISEEMEGEAKGMKGLLVFFRLDENDDNSAHEE